MVGELTSYWLARRRGVVLGSVEGGSYSPVTDLGTDLLGYWEANRSDLITQSGGFVSSWKDVVAGYDAVQAGGSAKPGYSATGFNGAACITYDGTDDELTLTPTPASFPIGSTGVEMWGLAQNDALVADATSRYVVGYGGDTASVSRRVGRNVASSANRASLQLNTSVAELTVDFTGRHVLRGEVGSTDSFVSIDGTKSSVLSVVPTTTGIRLRLGASNSGATAFWQGSIAAVLITKPLSTDKATALAAWLNSRR